MRSIFSEFTRLAQGDAREFSLCLGWLLGPGRAQISRSVRDLNEDPEDLVMRVACKLAHQSESILCRLRASHPVIAGPVDQLPEASRALGDQLLAGYFRRSLRNAVIDLSRKHRRTPVIVPLDEERTLDHSPSDPLMRDTIEELKQVLLEVADRSALNDTRRAALKEIVRALFSLALEHTTIKELLDEERRRAPNTSPAALRDRLYKRHARARACLLEGVIRDGQRGQIPSDQVQPALRLIQGGLRRRRC